MDGAFLNLWGTACFARAKYQSRLHPPASLWGRRWCRELIAPGHGFSNKLHPIKTKWKNSLSAKYSSSVTWALPQKSSRQKRASDSQHFLYPFQNENIFLRFCSQKCRVSFSLFCAYLSHDPFCLAWASLASHILLLLFPTACSLERGENEHSAL